MKISELQRRYHLNYVQASKIKPDIDALIGAIEAMADYCSDAAINAKIDNQAKAALAAVKGVNHEN